MLGLCFCARAFSSCGKRGPLFIAVCGPLTIAASLVAEHRLQTRRLSSCGSQARLLRGMWDPPRPGLEPVSPASTGRLSTTAPPGKPQPVEFFSVTQGWVLGMEIETRPWKLPSPSSPTVGVLGETPVLLGQLSRVREGRSEKLSRSLNLNSQGRKHNNND